MIVSALNLNAPAPPLASNPLAPRQYRQGDVLVMAVDGLPPCLTPVPREDGRVVLAHGEVTGHAHAIRSDRVHFFREDGSGRGFIQVHGSAPVALVHEEHRPIELAPGTYEVVRQREYEPRARPRAVAD
ncbi:MAG: hypothetical protein RLY86_1426 [Pseudomonadota bacterium]|jgi:hypothetical protein